MRCGRAASKAWEGGLEELEHVRCPRWWSAAATIWTPSIPIESPRPTRSACRSRADVEEPGSARWPGAGAQLSRAIDRLRPRGPESRA